MLAATWTAWFAEQEVRPFVVTYEALVADPRGTVLAILDELGVAAPPDWRPESPHRRQADEVSAAWVRRYAAREHGTS